MLDELVEFRLAYDAAIDAANGGSNDEEIDALRNALEIAYVLVNA